MPRISKGIDPNASVGAPPGRNVSRARVKRTASAPAAGNRNAVAAGLDFQLLFESLPGLFLVLSPDPQFTILGASDAYLRATSAERQAVVGRGLADAFADESDDAHATGVQQLRASLERVVAGRVSDAMAVQKHDIHRLYDRGGDSEARFWRPVNFPVLSAGGELIYIVHRIEDVTEFVGLSREQERERERAAALERREQATNLELDALSYSISHDLRAPLRAIDGFSRMLEEDYGERLDDEGRRLLGVVLDNSRKMSELINAILELSRLGRKPLSIAEIDMRRAVEHAMTECETGRSALRIELGPLPAPRGDPVLIKQVWRNLLSNALKFSAQRDQPMATVSGTENDAEYVYCIKDNGVGFDMRYCDRLFGLFQRLHSEERFPGIGVGLAVVRRIVARHGGRVWAESNPNAGATFCFSLPKETGDG